MELHAGSMPIVFSCSYHQYVITVFLQIIPYDGIRTIPKRPSEGQARAKFNFFAQTHLELSLVKGETL
jgi:hypothetical protein